MMIQSLKFQIPRDVSYLLRMLIVLGCGTFVAGVLFAPERAWMNLLIGTNYILGMGLAGLFFVAVMYISGAAWTTAFRRVPEAMARIVPVGAVLFVVLVFGISHIYEWTHAEVVQHNPMLAAKSSWLNVPFFLIRAAFYFAVWIFFAFKIVGTSREQDSDGNILHTMRNVRKSAIFIVLFAITFVGSSFDWIMSVQPEWYSTIFGWYNFAGIFVSGLAAMTVVVIILRRAGAFQGIITEHHLHDLGKYCFAFSTFWAYLWFSQYMLIWYANVPEETAFYVRQMKGGWQSLFLLNLGLNWLIPFVTLMSRAAKRSEGILLKVCAVLLIGRWLDLYLMVMPAKGGETPPFGIWELGTIAGIISLFFFLTFRSLNRANLVPLKDPTLERSLHHHI